MTGWALVPENMFLKLKKAEGGFISPFLIGKCIKNHIGDSFTVKSLKNFEYLIKIEDQIQFAKVMAINKIGEDNIEITPMSHLNQSKGIIRSESLKYINDEDLKEFLREAGVLEFQRFLRKGTPNTGEQGTKPGLANSGTFLLTFDSPQRPEKIILHREQFIVKQFVQRPLQCKKCHAYGHIAKSCEKPQLCGRCGTTGHDQEKCESPAMLCTNCQGAHTSYSTECQIYKNEISIQKIKEDKNISFRMARAEFEKKNTQTTMAQVVQKTTNDGLEKKIDSLIAAVTDQSRQIAKLGDMLEKIINLFDNQLPNSLDINKADPQTETQQKALEPLSQLIQNQQKEITTLSNTFEKFLKSIANPTTSTSEKNLRPNTSHPGGSRKPVQK